MTLFDTGVSLAAAGGIAITALAMVLTPGPNMIYLVSRSISQGPTAGMISLLGTGVGFVTYLTMTNLGLALVFFTIPWLFIALKATGVVYLAWLAWLALRPGGHGAFEARTLRRDTSLRLFQMGLVTNLLNPKAAIMYLALIPQFIEASAGNTVVQGFTLGVIQITVSMIVNAAIIIGAGAISRFFATRPTWLRWQRLITGTLLGSVAVLLALEVPQRARL